ncbi:MAG: HAD family hydrolase [Paracoccaceae bacterium]
MPSAVLFDCDGVVVDSEAIAFDLLRCELAGAGLVLDHTAMERHFLGATVADLFHKARGLGADLPPGWVGGFYERLYARLRMGVPLVPGIGAVLDRLAAAGVPVAIGSNGSAEKMQITLGQHPAVLARFGGHLYSGQALGRPKPAPDLYLHAAAILGVEPARAVVVEDSATGARAARAAGMRCYGYAPTGGAALAAEGARLFTDMADLPGLLGV